MKKAFMFLGFAMCATFAFAQTNISRHSNNYGTEKIKLSGVQKPAVDYKASIFTKENGLDTLWTFTFNSADATRNYDSVGVVTATDHISEHGKDSTFGTAKHTVSADWGFWKHYSNINDFVTNFQADYPNTYDTNNRDFVVSRMDTSINPNVPDDGFMFLGYDGAAYAGRVNSFFEMPSFTRSTTGKLVVIGLTQAYAKYYDFCYIDYKIGNNWYTREVNVTGIDVEVNRAAAAKVRVTMPYNLKDEGTIHLRVRAYSYRRGNAYGYFWAIDNLAIIVNNNNKSWSFNSASPLDGFYGTLPNTMSIPITFGVNARNTSIEPITGAKISVTTSSDNYASAISSTPLTINAGDPEQDTLLLINERGFYNEDYALTSGYQAWLGEFALYGDTTGILPAGFQGRSLSTSTIGQNFYTVTASESTNAQNMTRTFDTILYSVSDYNVTSSVPGYVWGRDNGLIPSRSAFRYAFMTDPNDGNNYITQTDEDKHTWERGYRVHMRYTTGSTIPTDQNGKPWRLQGMELIASTDIADTDMVGAKIVPLVYEEVYTSDGYLRFVEVPTGIASYSIVEANDINSTLYTNGGYIIPNDDFSNYKSIKFKFLNQPEMKPNTAYRFGYALNDDAKFNVAKTENRYADLTDSMWHYYDDNPVTEPYYNQNRGPVTYLDVIVIDAAADNGEITGWNINEYPMIRAIVGDETDVERANITIDCSEPQNPVGASFYAKYGADEICNDIIQGAVGSTITVSLYPEGEHGVIDSVIMTTIDNSESTPHSVREKLELYDEDDNPDGIMARGDYSVYDTNSHGEEYPILDRYYYVVYFENIPEKTDYVLTAYTHYEDFHIGIDPVAPEVKMTLAPNPATSSVKLNLNGVSGMVNCSILDMSGRMVYNANINAEAENMINVSNMPAGAYFVRVTNNTFSKIEKLIIK